MASPPRKADVVIVGYGGAAGPLSVELSRAGYSVVALERGPRLHTETDFAHAHDTLRYRVRGEWTPRFDSMPITFRRDPLRPAVPDRSKVPSLVGGSTVTWGGFSFRFFEDDFRVASTIQERYGRTARLGYLREDGAAIEDWPLSYADLEPYYEQVEYAIGIGGWPGNIEGKIRPVHPDEGNPYEAPRRADYPFRPLRDNATGLTFREGALQLGFRPFRSPTGIVTEPYTSPYGITRPACTYCAFCSGFGCWNGAKSSTLVSLLPAAEATGRFELRPDCHVLRINHRGGRASSVEYVDASGAVRVQPGDIFILAAYTVQNIRLLLHSGIRSGGLVGRYFMNRPGPKVSAVFGDRYLNGYSSPGVQSQCVDDLNGENAAGEKLALPEDEFFIRGAAIISACQRTPLETYHDVPPDVPRWGTPYKRFLQESLNRYLSLYVVTEGLPYESACADLDPDYRDRYGVPAVRIHRRIGRNEERMSRFFFRTAAEILRAAGALRVWGSDTPEPTGTSTHDVGGCRMGRDPRTSVTNRYGQVWETPNVFVAGGALFPTMSGHGPQETVWALSYWTADALVGGRINLDDAGACR
jgi:gluconate 2-dehydrogenase alpha chain